MLETIINSLKRTAAIAGLSFGLYGCADNITINNYINFTDGGNTMQSDSSVQNDSSTNSEADAPLPVIPDAGVDGGFDAAEPDAGPVADAYVALDAPSPCTQKLYFFDNDGDGYGNIAENALFCEGQQPNNYVSMPNDCDDSDSSVWDETIAYLDNDGDNFGAGNLVTVCQGNSLPAGYALNDMDCDDFNFDINPTAQELCDNIDNNCNFSIDDGLNLGEACYNGVGECEREGAVVCADNGSTTCDAVAGEPQFDLCGCQDNDCDGETDCQDLEGKIIFTKLDNPMNEPDIWNREIFTVNANGCALTNLTNYIEAADFSPSWSPDGTKIAFTSYRDGNLEIYVMNADGSNQTNLTNNPEDINGDHSPSWSPDGTKIAYASWFEIYVMDSDGNNKTRLTDARSAGGHNNPTWSPDGTKLAFSSNSLACVYQAPWASDGEICVVDIDNSNQYNLTNYAGADECCPSWSPDGSKIAFVSNRNGNNEIYIMNSDGSNPTNLTNHPADDYMPSWSPDGSKIIFTRNGKPYIIETNNPNSPRRLIDEYVSSYWDDNIDWAL